MKNELRNKLKNICKSECSNELANLLKNTDAYKQAKNIMLFYPLKNEVNLLSLLKDSDKNFFLPRIEGEELLCCPYKEGDEIIPSTFKTMEPITKPVEKNQIDLVIVPALCCDKNNYRLGYGKGFYDRFLKDYRGKTVVCLPKECIVETVYPEPHDIPANLVISY